VGRSEDNCLDRLVHIHGVLEAERERLRLILASANHFSTAKRGLLEISTPWTTWPSSEGCFDWASGFEGSAVSKYSSYSEQRAKKLTLTTYQST
jgi:hypothetical protein